jgi:microcystin-dependent protein
MAVIKYWDGTKWLPVDAGGLSSVPVGVTLPYAGSAAPNGWLLCDGRAISRTGYAALYTILGTAYGTGDGSTTFNLPDMRGRAPIGAGQGTGLANRALASKGGEEAHILTWGETGAHYHNIGVTVNSIDINHYHDQNNHTHGQTGGQSVDHSHAQQTQSTGTITGTAQFVKSGQESGGAHPQLSTFGASVDHSHATGGPNIANTNWMAQNNTHAHTGTGSSDYQPANGATTGHNVMQPYIALNYIIRY